MLELMGSSRQMGCGWGLGRLAKMIEGGALGAFMTDDVYLLGWKVAREVRSAGSRERAKL